MNKLQVPGVFSLFINFNWRTRIPPSNLEKLLLISSNYLSREDQKVLNMRLDNSIKLSKEQEAIKSLVTTKNENIFYTGAAGTGKSVLLQSIISELKSKYGPRSVAVTASTGTAAINIGGQTLHSFAGFTPRSKLIDVDRLIKELASFRRIARRWKMIKVLVIDEVSMLDAVLFDKLNRIAKHFRSSEKPFGGLQLILTGDFCQLPPVQKDEEVNYCFEAASWPKSIDHTIQLTEVHRQCEKEFIEMLNEFRFGHISDKSKRIMSSLEKSPKYEKDGIDVIELYALNKYVHNINSTKLSSIPYQEIVYEANDWEPKEDGQLESLVKNCLALTQLKLKLGAQVMLIKNFTHNLVNGSKGVVVGWFSTETMDFHDEVPTDNAKVLFPVVRFINGQIKLIPPAEWTLENEDGRVVAKREQIPLILSWAISIHKSQGQTLERVKVNLDRVFENGQTYVALSRAKSLNSLQVLNFSPDKVFAEEKVKDFYHSLEEIV